MTQWLTVDHDADDALLIDGSDVDGDLPPALRAMVEQRENGRVAVSRDDAEAVRAWIIAREALSPMERHGVELTEGP
jgi:hypothetical protein